MLPPVHTEKQIRHSNSPFRATTESTLLVWSSYEKPIGADPTGTGAAIPAEADSPIELVEIVEIKIFS